MSRLRVIDDEQVLQCEGEGTGAGRAAMVSARSPLEPGASRPFRIPGEWNDRWAAVASSLQDALRGAGLVKSGDPKRARRKRRESRPPVEARRGTNETGSRKEAPASSEAPAALSTAQARSLRTRTQAIARDPWLSGARQARSRREERERALLERARSSRLDDPRATRAFHFTRGRRIKEILLTEEQHRALLAGEIMIVGLPGEHMLLSRALALEIEAERPDTFVHRVKTGGAGERDEDPAHEVPDDLVW